ncbi:MAG: hypothetical protein JWM16_6277, partial [Verrucomicrobiales bacterium]|nr:hypothetical protein [Verrucomicrobiales bacterium]
MSAAASRVFARCFLGSLLLLSRVSDAAPVDLSRLPAPADKKVNFSEDVQPLFAKHCYNCHGPEKQRNNFRLDQKAATFKGGDDFAPDIIPGKSAESPLIHFVAGLIKDKVMPQKGERLSTQEIAILRAWIDQGAQWPDVLAGSDLKEKARLWALEPLQQPALPTVKKQTWVQNSVDTFVLAKLESKSLSPSRPADKATLIRRTSYALTGLPPSPNEVEAFMRDTSPKAFEKVVDRYLASPRYGERWGRHWLDLVRFCESHGFEYDKIRDHAWRYRDYVIESFNSDKPYSEFIKEQLAGDALKPQSTERIVATGFLVCAPWDEAGNNQVGKTMKARVREEEIEDMVAVVGQTFLGLTVNCARCHDHKFDPIPQRDYYALKAALAGVRHGNRSLLTEAELKARDAEKAKVLTQLKELEKAASMFEDTGRKRLQANANPRKNLEGLEPAQPRPLACWTFDGNARDSTGGLHGELKGSAMIKDGRLRLDGKTAYLETSPLQEPLREKTLEAWVSLTDLEQSGGAVMTVELNGNGDKFDSIVYGERDKHQWVAGSELFRRSLPLDAPPETAKPGELLHMALVYSADNSIRIYRNGELLGKPYTPTRADNSTLQEYPAGTTRVLIGLRHHGAKNGFLAGEIEEARLYNRALSSAEIKASLKSGPRVYTTDEILARLTASEKEIYQRNDKERAKLSEQLNKLANPPQAYAANSKQPEPTFILRRGDVEKPREQVGAGALSCLSDLPPDFHLAEDAPEAERRLKLAEWITSP